MACAQHLTFGVGTGGWHGGLPFVSPAVQVSPVAAFIDLFEPGHDGPPGDQLWFLQRILQVLAFGAGQVRQGTFPVLRGTRTFSCVHTCFLFFICGFTIQQAVSQTIHHARRAEGDQGAVQMPGGCGGLEAFHS